MHPCLLARIVLPLAAKVANTENSALKDSAAAAAEGVGVVVVWVRVGTSVTSVTMAKSKELGRSAVVFVVASWVSARTLAVVVLQYHNCQY